LTTDRCLEHSQTPQNLLECGSFKHKKLVIKQQFYHLAQGFITIRHMLLDGTVNIQNPDESGFRMVFFVRLPNGPIFEWHSNTGQIRPSFEWSTNIDRLIKKGF
jgi:hypothetical protein